MKIITNMKQTTIEANIKWKNHVNKNESLKAPLYSVGNCFSCIKSQWDQIILRVLKFS